MQFALKEPPTTLRKLNAPANFRIGAKSHGRSIDRGMRSTSEFGATSMSFSGLATPQGRRNTILPSCAVSALGGAGVHGVNALSTTRPAYAAAVSTADLPQNA